MNWAIWSLENREGVEELIDQVCDYEFDALAIHSIVECEEEVVENYFKNGGVNPWGGVEAVASRGIAHALDVPVAHAPLESLKNTDPNSPFNTLPYTTEVNKRMAPEIISVSYLVSVIKGLNRAPRLSYDKGLSYDDVDFMISPVCCGQPHEACVRKGIPIIIVEENTVQVDVPSVDVGGCEVIHVDNYLEAAGLIMAKIAGVHPSSVRAD